jgi:hypothetical protein
MSNTHDNSNDQNELHELKRQARANALRLKIAQQNAALAALRSQGYSDKLEGYDDPSNRVDYRDYLFETPPLFGAMPTTRNDRDQGRDFPIFQTEQELAVIRGAARLITASNPIAVGLLNSLTNYVIGNGFHYAVSPRDAGAGELAKTASSVLEEFLEENN